MPVAVDPEDANHLVGAGSGVVSQLQPSYWLPDGWLGYISSFYTEEGWRGRGIATRILDEILQWLKAQGVLRAHLYAQSEESLRLFLDQGLVRSVDDNLWIKLG